MADAAHIELDLPGAHVRFTTRAGGVSEGPYASLNLGRWTDDDPGAVAENRRRAADGRPLAFGRQVHGTRVLIVDGATADDAIADADGVATAASGVAALVLTADCLPVALATPKAIAMVHAGWRGPGRRRAGGGRARRPRARRRRPAARRRSVPARAAAATRSATRSPRASRTVPRRADRTIDLKAIAAQRLRAAGAVEVLDVERCTMCEPDVFFSHRASGGLTGRQGGLAWRS